MPILNLRILVYNPPPTGYFPGEDVSGKIIITTDQAEKTQALILKFYGLAAVNWTVKGKNHKDEEIYYEFFNYPLGSESGGVTIPSGESSYPFSFKLPHTKLPASFEGPNGKVEYVLEVSVSKHIMREVIMVQTLDDTNAFGRGNWSASSSKRTGLLCCADGPLSMKVNMTNWSTVPGENLSLKVEVNNQSRHEVEDITIELLQHVKYIAKSAHSRTGKSIIKMGRAQPVSSGDTEVWNAEVEIPLSTPPTGLGGGCKLIDVTYLARVDTIVNGSAANGVKILCPPIIIRVLPRSSAVDTEDITFST